MSDHANDPIDEVAKLYDVTARVLAELTAFNNRKTDESLARLTEDDNQSDFDPIYRRHARALELSNAMSHVRSMRGVCDYVMGLLQSEAVLLESSLASVKPPVIEHVEPPKEVVVSNDEPPGLRSLPRRFRYRYKGDGVYPRGPWIWVCLFPQKYRGVDMEGRYCGWKFGNCYEVEWIDPVDDIPYLNSEPEKGGNA